jgi:ubiquinone/menaquinone biosynthesis C-methylase UbiE
MRRIHSRDDAIGRKRQAIALWTVFFAGIAGCWMPVGWGACPAAAEEESPAPPPLTQYKGRTIAPTMTYHGADWLTRASREREEHCQTLLKALDLKPGQAICDMGCGNGYYTLKMAKIVGREGRVLAVDVQPEMLHMLELRAKERRIGNVEPVSGTLVDPRLPAGELDLILCVDVYHEFSHPEPMLAAMRKALKPRGRLVLVEFRAEDPEVPILPLHKMTKAQVLAELEPNGFKLVESFDKLPWQHVLFFERDEPPAEGEPLADEDPSANESRPPNR